jgi:hypothetical protein
MAVFVLRAPRRQQLTATQRQSLIAAGEEVPDGDSKEEVAAGASASSTVQADPLWFFAGVAIILIGIWRATGEYNPGTDALALKEGISEFALLYIFAQALERFSEFVSFIPGIGVRIGARLQSTDGSGSVSKATAESRRDQAVAEAFQAVRSGDTSTTAPVAEGETPAPEEPDQKSTDAANAQHDLDVIRSNRAVFFFALNTAIAAYVAANYGFLILTLIGVDKPNEWMDITVTALAIGGGTKPLHDLITNIQKKKEDSEDSTNTPGS